MRAGAALATWTRCEPTEWFAASPSAVWCNGGAKGPGGRVHAKAYGTLVTACGLPSDSWIKFFSLPFDRVVEQRCPHCASAVRQGGRAA